MFFRRSGQSELEGAHQALAEGQYDVAFALLETAARRPHGRADKGRAWLHLAEVYALYGEDGVENGLPALRNAVEAEPSLASHPLYQALFWEFKVFHGGTVGDVKRGLRGVTAGDPVASYHAASALLSVGAPKSAARRLRQMEADALPLYLRWRRWSLLGQCAEALGNWEEAALAFERAVSEVPESERDPERLSLAGALLELGRTDEVLDILDQVDSASLLEEELGVQRYILGRAQLELGNPNRALELLREAKAMLVEGAIDDHAYNVAFSTAQALTAVGAHDEAAAMFREALELAPAEHRPFTQHEAAYALIETEKLFEAEELLAEVVGDPGYPHRAEALADIADVRLKLGEFDAAETLAQQALEMGATASACLCLGNIAYEYFRLDEAVRWFEQAVSASQPGDAIWVSAHQVLADAHVQLGPSKAERVLWYARLALKYTDPSSEWYLPLRRYADEARAQLGGNDRPLN